MKIVFGLLSLLLVPGLCSSVNKEAPLQPAEGVSFTEQYNGGECIPGKTKGDCSQECICNTKGKWDCSAFQCPLIKPGPNCYSASPANPKYPNRCCNEIVCPCDNYNCNKGYDLGSRHCQLDENNKPQCVCDEGCTKEFRPVCGSDGKTYSNLCLLQVAACKAGKTIRVVNDGPCACNTVPPTCSEGETCNNCNLRCTCSNTSEWNCVSACPPSLQENCYFVDDTGVFPDHCCRIPVCPCQTVRCGLRGGQPTSCELGEDKTAKCVCNRICPFVFAQVCGSDGKTYSNECALNVAACENDKLITVVSQGACKTRYGGADLK